MSKPYKKAPISGKDQVPAYTEADGPYTTEMANGEAKVLYAKSGVGASGENGGAPTMTFPALLKQAASKKGKHPALRAERPLPPLENGKAAPSAPHDTWKTWTYRMYYEDSLRTAKGMMSLGHEQFDAVAIFGFNSPEWFISETGAMCAGGKAAGVYPSDTPDQLQYKALHSDASIAMIEGETEFNKFKQVYEQLPYLKAIVCWAYDGGADLTRSDGSVVRVLTFDQLLKEGDKVEDSVLEERMSKIKPTHCCALIYTSGTTGNPKAVMISHDNVIFESASVLYQIDFVGNKPEQERILSYLPLSHVAGMLVDIVFPIVLSATRPGWCTAYFARPYDLKASTIKDRLQCVQPTVFLGVPRVWEKIAEKIKAVSAQTKGLKKKIGRWAKGKGMDYQTQMQIGGTGAKPSLYGLADKLVLSKIKANLGLTYCKFAFSGAAPLTLETLEFFGAFGININEVYGMSESTGAVTWSTDLCHQWGTIGYAMPGCEVKIFKVDSDDINVKTECPAAKDIMNAKDEEQGEICFRGRNTMMGYMANPKLGAEHVEEMRKKNAGTVDREGWLHSGDMGAISKRGMVKITGRYKELIITAGGENVAPVPIEDEVKRLCPAVSNIMMIGDKRKFNICVLTLKAVGATGELPGGDKLDGDAKTLVPGVSTITQAMDNKAYIAAIEDAIKKTNANGRVCPSNASKIQKFTILPRDFSVTTDELTATLKLKRGVVMKKYADMIETMYNSKDTFVRYNGPVPEVSM